MLEQRLEPPQISANPELAVLQERAIEMARYYYKGFGTSIFGIISDGKVYLEHMAQIGLSTRAYARLQKIEGFYTTIPFDKLHGREEFYPLFVVKKLFPRLKTAMYGVFKDGNADAFGDLGLEGDTIISVGELYSESLRKLLREIRVFPEAKDFRIAIPDQLKEHIWYF